MKRRWYVYYNQETTHRDNEITTFSPIKAGHVFNTPEEAMSFMLVMQNAHENVYFRVEYK